jgi:hypothetical protein
MRKPINIIVNIPELFRFEDNVINNLTISDDELDQKVIEVMLEAMRKVEAGIPLKDPFAEGNDMFKSAKSIGRSERMIWGNAGIPVLGYYVHGIHIAPTQELYDGTYPPTSVGHLGVTKADYTLSWNDKANAYVLDVGVRIHYSPAFNIPGKYGTMEEENTGVTLEIKTHEHIHEERDIQAIKEIYPYTTSSGGKEETYNGTIPEIATQIDKELKEKKGKYEERVNEINTLYSKKNDELYEIYNKAGQSDKALDRWKKMLLNLI